FRFRIAFQLLTLFRDDRFRCAGDKAFVRQFVLDTADFTFNLRHFFRQTRQLIFFVDEASHRDQQLCTVDDLRNGNRTFVIGRQHGDTFQTRQRLQEATVFIYATFCIRAATTQQQLQRFTRRDVHFCTDVTYRNDRLLQPLGVGQCGFIDLRRIVLRERLQHDGVSGDAAKYFHTLPDGFGDERNDRMREAQQTFQYSHQRMASTAQFCFGATVHYRLGQLEIPVTELVPGELIQNACGDIEAEAVQRFAVRFDGLVELRQNPAVRQRQRHFAAVEAAILTFCVHQHKAAGVPQLVTEVTVTFQTLHIPVDVTTGRRQRRQGEAQRVSTVRLNAV